MGKGAFFSMWIIWLRWDLERTLLGYLASAC
jgi:hypothetical protein